MNRRWQWVLFAGLVGVQLAVPSQMILREQRTLAEGTVYRFRTAPVDPADPFRGRYVQLQFTAACVAQPAPSDTERTGRSRRVYARLELDGEGYARIAALGDERPAQGDYLRVRSRGHSCEGGGTWVELPFDRYYLPEDLAPRAEEAYREMNRRAGIDDEADVDRRRPAWAAVRVLAGHASLEDLYLDGRTVREHLAAAPAAEAGNAP